MKASEHTDIRSQFFGRPEPVLPEPTNEQRAVTSQPAPVGDSAESLTCLPADRRPEALALLQQDPSARAVIEGCNQGRLNCWDAMEQLGMDPWKCDAPVLAEHKPDPTPSRSEPTTPSPRAMEWGCTECSRHDDGFCWLPRSRTWRNIQVMSQCPGRETADVTHSIQAGNLTVTSGSLEDSQKLYRPERDLEQAVSEFGCKACDAHQRGWCGLAKFESWVNIRVLRACPAKTQ